MSLGEIILPILVRALLKLVASYSKDINWDVYTKNLETKVRTAVPGQMFDDGAARIVTEAITLIRRSLENVDQIDVKTIASLEKKLKDRLRA